MALGEKIVDGAVDSVGYAAKDGLKSFLTVGLIGGIIGALMLGGLGFGIAALAAGSGAIGTGGIVLTALFGAAGFVGGGAGAGWLGGSIGAAWGLVTGPFRGAKERRQEQEENPTLAQGVSRQQELEMLRSQNQSAREQLNAMSAQMMQAQAMPTTTQQLAQQAAQDAAINGGSQPLPPDGFVAQENARRGLSGNALPSQASDLKTQNKQFVESLAAGGSAAYAGRH